MTHEITLDDAPVYGKKISMGAGDYTPYVVPSDQLPEVKVVGANELNDCIGIIGWHEDSKAIYLYHMNEVDLPRLCYSSLGLLKTVTDSDKDQSQIEDVREIIKKSMFDYSKGEENIKAALSNLFESPINNKLTQVHYTLATQNSRNLEKLLDTLSLLGIDSEQVSIDSNSESIFIDRESGRISKCHENTRPVVPETSVVEAEGKVVEGSKSRTCVIQ